MMGQVRAVRFNTLSEGMHSSGRGDRLDQPSFPIPQESARIKVNQGWQACLEFLQESLPSQTIQTWFLPIIPVSFVDNILFLKVQSKFIANWLDANYRMILQEAVGSVFGTEARVDFIIENSGKNDPVPSDLSASVPVENSAASSAEKSSPAAGALKPAETYLNPRFCLDNFFAGVENRFALKAVEHVGCHPGQSPFNPLVLHGDVGSGKTHLLHALGNFVSQKYHGKRHIYMTSEIFLHQYIIAVQSQKIQKFVGALRAMDIFLFDDLQFLAGKIKSQEMLLLILRELVKRGSQVAVAVNVPPNQLPQFNPQLVAFLQSGLIADVHHSDRLTREHIVRHHLAVNDIVLEEKIIQFLAEALGNNIHQLHAVMVRIVAQVSLMKKDLSFDEIRYIVSQVCPLNDPAEANSTVGIRRHVTIQEIVKATSQFYDIPVDVLQGVSRKQKITTARQVAIYLCRELTEESLNSIGFHFSNLHHASVIYAHNKIRQKLKTTPRLRSAVEKIRALFA